MKTKLFFTVMLSCLIIFGSAQIIHVPADQPTIQAGITAAFAGDTVLVAEGTYYENINFWGKAITVASSFIVDGDTNHINNTIINGSQPDDPDIGSVVSFLTGEDTTSILYGFTITGGTGTEVESGAARIGGGVLCYYAGGKIIHNKIEDNHLTHSDKAGGAGIGCLSYGEEYWLIIGNNTINNNSCTSSGLSAYGAGIYSVVNTIVKENIITGNSCDNTGTIVDGGGIEIEQLPGSTIYAEITGNVVQNNVLTGTRGLGGGITVSKLKVKLENNIVKYNSMFVETYGDGGGIYVDTPMDTIILANNDISHNTIKSAYYARGGGVIFWNPAGHLILTGNQINYDTIIGTQCRGAGVLFRYPVSTLSVINNDFIGNYGEPGAINSNGGGICLNDSYDSLAVIEGNRFINNTAKLGGGFFGRRSYNLQITNNLFIEDTAYNGGGLFLYHYTSSTRATMHPWIANNTFYGNYADFGGALFLNCELNVPVIFNNIFSENQSPAYNDIYYYVGMDTILVANCNIDENEVYGPWKGKDNINEYPGFVDENCHIDESSPCIRVGTDSLEFMGTWYYCPATDFDGEDRPYPSVYCDPIPDIGADEIELDCVGVNEFNTQHATLNIQSYPNPTRGISHFTFHISQYQSVSCSIYDLHGREVALVLDEKLPAGEHVVLHDLSALPDGVYFVVLRAKGEGHRAVSKLVKMN